MFLQSLKPNWQKAQIHGKANKVGKVAIQQQHITRCNCCRQPLQKEPIDLCENTKQLGFLGFGVSLYFTFFKSCITLLILSTLSYHIISLYWGISHNVDYCKQLQKESSGRLLASGDADLQCRTFMVRFARLQDSVSIQEQLMRISTWIIQLIYLIYARNNLRKTAHYYDERTTTLSDYSILIKNLRPQKKIREQLQKVLRQCKQNLQIKQCVLLANSPQIQEIYQQIHQNNQKIIFCRENPQKSTQKLEYLQQIVQQLKNKLIAQANNYRSSHQKDELQCEKVIIVVQSDQVKTQIIQDFPKQYKQSLQGLFQNGKIQIEQAPEPKQIIWENIIKNRTMRKGKIILSWLLSLLILAILTVIIYFILHAKTSLLIDSLNKDTDQETKKQEINGAIAIVYLTIFAIMLFNKLALTYIFQLLTNLQKQESGFKYQKSFGLKYCLGLFFTTAIMTLIVEGIQSRNFYTNLYGLIDEETLMFFLTVTFIPIFWCVNLFQCCRQCNRQTQRKKDVNQTNITQQQANTLMEDTAYDIGKRYAQIIQIVWFTLLYQTLIPLGGFLSLIGLIFYYWVDKYNLLRRSVLKIGVSSQLSFYFLTVLEFSLVFEPSGALIFDGLLRQLDSFNLSTSIVMIVVALIFMVLPKNDWIDKLYHEHFYLEQKDYESVKQEFIHTYKNCHPILKLPQKFVQQPNKHHNEQTNQVLMVQQQQDRRYQITLHVNNGPLD